MMKMYCLIVDLSNIIVPFDITQISNEKIIIQTEVIVRHLIEKLSDLLTKSSTSDQISATSTLLSTLISGDIQQQRELLSRLLLDPFSSKTYAEVATQVINITISKILFYFILFYSRLHHLLQTIHCLVIFPRILN